MSSAQERPAVGSREAVEWYGTLFARTALGVILLDRQRRILDCNEGFCRLVGRRRDLLLGHATHEFAAPQDADVGARAMAELLAGADSSSYERRFLRPDDEASWARVNLSVVSREEDLFAAIVEAIGERKRAEAERMAALDELHDKTDQLARAHELAKLGTFVVDTRSRTIAVSGELARILGAGDEPFEMPVEDYRRTFIHPEDREWSSRLSESGYLTGEPVTWERRLIRRDGQVIWETSHAGYELDGHGHPVRVVGVVQDITERVRLADELRRSRTRIVEAAAQERLRLERDLHDGAQNLLLAVQIKLALLAENLGASPISAQIDQINADMDAALDQLRELAHGIYPARLREIGLQEALRVTAEAAPIPVRVSTDDVGRYPPAIEEAIIFCAREAVQNAVKHAGPGARVTLSVTAGDRGLEFDFADDGPGFDPRDQPLGFGLTSMRDRIGAVGGRLTIDANPGAGSCIRGNVPVDTPRNADPVSRPG